MQRLYTREQYLERIAWVKAARREISLTTDVMSDSLRKPRPSLKRRLLCSTRSSTTACSPSKYSPRPNTPSLSLDDVVPDSEKARRLTVLMERQRDIQKRRNQRHIGHLLEAMVEGKNEARAQMVRPHSQNKVLNFVVPAGTVPTIGQYATVEITGSFPNSLLGQMVYKGEKSDDFR